MVLKYKSDFQFLGLPYYKGLALVNPQWCHSCYIQYLSILDRYIYYVSINYT